MFLCNIS